MNQDTGKTGERVSETYGLTGNSAEFANYMSDGKTDRAYELFTQHQELVGDLMRQLPEYLVTSYADDFLIYAPDGKKAKEFGRAILMEAKEDEKGRLEEEINQSQLMTKLLMLAGRVKKREHTGGEQ